MKFWVGFAGPFETREEAEAFLSVAQGENYIEEVPE
jgi:hypothetical protein